MKIVIFLLTCIAAAVEAANIKTDENSVTLMNSKITDGLPVFEDSRRNHLVSVQLHEKHFCTGTIFLPNAVISTANCALLILSHLSVRDGEGNPIVRVCFAHKLDDSSRCTSILDIAKYYLFGPNNVQDINGDPSIPYNVALILVEGDLVTCDSEVLEYFDVDMFPQNYNLRVTGWESKQKCSSSQDSEVYYINNHKDIKVKLMTNEDCHRYFHRSFTLPSYAKCIQREAGGYFELEDIGSPIYMEEYGDALGIVSYISTDKGTAVMQLLTIVTHYYPSSNWKIMDTPPPTSLHLSET